MEAIENQLVMMLTGEINVDKYKKALEIFNK